MEQDGNTRTAAPTPGQREGIDPKPGLAGELPVSKWSRTVQGASSGTSAPRESFPVPGKRKPGAPASPMWSSALICTGWSRVCSLAACG